ncbi:acetoacetyl-CoA synthetase [Myxococcaceae bacterium]|jgi:acetoacetyl-CoA synthetase|nr:acetoacetyl-CoA synthetase [Myxococcaceae bacterium]
MPEPATSRDPRDEKPIFSPSPEAIAAANLTAFRALVNQRSGRDVSDYERLWRWSIEAPEAFWTSVWDFCDVRAETRGERVIENPDRMPGARFFPDARLSFSENLLRRRDDSPALVFRGEDVAARSLSWRELHGLVSRLRQALEAEGVGPGDRVAGFVANLPETVAAMLAAASLGAVWSSCSPDFGVDGVLDRFGQIGPVVLFVSDRYRYAGRWHDCLGRAAEIARALPGLRRTIVLPYDGEAADPGAVPDALTLDAAIAPFVAGEIAHARLAFSHPLYVLYSSGTTGKPKCIVHGSGGTLLQQKKEHVLHCDVKPGDRVFYFTTCGWMMWNWLVAALASEATLLLYDGSPFHPSGEALFDFARDERATLFGTSAKFIDACRKAGIEPRRTHELASLRLVTSTGSPLAPEGFDWVVERMKPGVQIASISGGTDILSCFVLGNPTAPVHRGEIQCRGLGMAVEAFDDTGRPVRGRRGELVCTKPFPSMPIGFWNDPDGSRYRKAYFGRFEGVWCHGDWIEITPRGGAVITGRSDAVLNPGGVRIGTAEIYRQVEGIDEIEEAIAVGQDWKGDVRIVLFVRLRPGAVLDAALAVRIRERLRTHGSPRHVPAKILEVADIPRTRSGKITELAVRDVIHGRAIANREALANPEALAHFEARPELAED